MLTWSVKLSKGGEHFHTQDLKPRMVYGTVMGRDGYAGFDFAIWNPLKQEERVARGERFTVWIWDQSYFGFVPRNVSPDKGWSRILGNWLYDHYDEFAVHYKPNLHHRNFASIQGSMPTVRKVRPYMIYGRNDCVGSRYLAKHQNGSTTEYDVTAPTILYWAKAGLYQGGNVRDY